MLSRHLRPSRADCRLHVLLFLGRWEDGGHVERLDPQLPAPAGRVVEMLIFLLLYLLVGRLQGLSRLSLGFLGHLVDEFSVQVVFRLGQHDALAGYKLSRMRGFLERHSHGLHERFTDVPDHFTTWCLGFRVEPELSHYVEEDLLMVPGLLEVLVPLLLEVAIDNALERGLVDLDAALLGL
jgi:hypothetical protein